MFLKHSDLPWQTLEDSQFFTAAKFLVCMWAEFLTQFSKPSSRFFLEDLVKQPSFISGSTCNTLPNATAGHGLMRAG
jgi:hypothetical protein